MYRNQSGEFVRGYWGLTVKYLQAAFPEQEVNRGVLVPERIKKITTIISENKIT